jgi:hypothetical protein
MIDKYASIRKTVYTSLHKMPSDCQTVFIKRERSKLQYTDLFICSMRAQRSSVDCSWFSGSHIAFKTPNCRNAEMAMAVHCEAQFRFNVGACGD